jgi:predicted ATP-grasp superfamily ATP-dependent carboligase
VSTTGAVVLGGDYQGLGIVRSLGPRGIPVCVVDDERSIARFSRYAGRAVDIPSLSDGERTVERLLALGAELGPERWVLFPTRDETVEILSRHRSTLSRHYRVPAPSWETFRWAWDKRNTYELARQLGIPTPRTWYPETIADLDAIDGDFPLVVKPAVKPRFFQATKAKAWRADSREELRERFEAALVASGGQPIMVQDLIPGFGERQFAYCAFFKDGAACGSMVVRRARQHPSDFGRASTYVETVEVPDLHWMAESFLRAAEYYGLAELEFKYDVRDKQHKLLDFNARTGGYHSLGVRAGVDFSYLLYADQMGEPVEPVRARSDIRWVRLITDLPVGALEILGGRLDWRSYLRSLRRVHTESVFSRDDPMPGIVELGLVPYLVVKRGF